MATFQTVDAYVASFPPDVQAVLQDVRRTIRKAAPTAEEAISYDIPAYKMHGKGVVSFAGWKRHVSIYPIPAVDDALAKEMAAYRAGKGTLRFPLDKPIPHTLIAQVVTLLIEQRT